MGECKTSMKPTLGILGGVFKKRAPKVAPDPKVNFADYVNAAYGHLEEAIKDESPLDDDFFESIEAADAALLRLIDIKGYDLEREQGREDYNRLALFRLEEMSRLLEHVKITYKGMKNVPSRFASPQMEMLRRIIEHIGEIGVEYASDG